MAQNKKLKKTKKEVRRPISGTHSSVFQANISPEISGKD